MKVQQLIEALQQMPPDAEVRSMWDGAARGEVQHIWLARGGWVVAADSEDKSYYTEDRPSYAPTEKEVGVWIGPK